MTSPSQILAKKRELDALKKSMLPGGLENLEHVHHIDITYTSNAIEGNTLTAGETALVLEKGIAVGGKSLEHHIQALDHARALQTAGEMGKADNERMDSRRISRTDIELFHLLLHRRTRWMEENFVNRDGNTEPCLSHHAPQSFKEFATWLRDLPDTPETAIAAHNRLLELRPFSVGNERTARLLMNFVLMRAGYPPVAIRPEDNPGYSAAIKTKGNQAVIEGIVLRRLEEALDLYLNAAKRTPAAANPKTDREP